MDPQAGIPLERPSAMIENLIIAIAVQPGLIAKAWAHPAAAMSPVTAGAVVPIEQATSILQRNRVVAQRIEGSGSRTSGAGINNIAFGDGGALEAADR